MDFAGLNEKCLSTKVSGLGRDLPVLLRFMEKNPFLKQNISNGHSSNIPTNGEITVCTYVDPSHPSAGGT